ncbi:hypothetical protein EIN_047510 [Entamoeba invadens IP1]|uniref:Nucleosome assembly protein n=1 Tax=Entamoeba invadens IP1 TaxID=370355 RepID=A0A0A1UDE1_ENTIV|nr:hypothetical protein EIN_047510 [Entamoeba invadens IP1]ELP94458.1 hypothetical protein EIN_047510 [Entamoeba invadens IP1]|eukprot:XP_004261229.1 hypothetical protein EIN_047510 [Entamoeba invadens IP1]
MGERDAVDKTYQDFLSNATKEEIDILTNEVEPQQTEFDNLYLQYDLTMWESFKALHQKVNSYSKSRESIKHYWKNVIVNSGVLKKIGSTSTDLVVLDYLKDVRLSGFNQIVTPDLVVGDKKRLRVGYTLNFIFEENEWFPDIELSKKISYLYNDTYTCGKLVNSGVVFYDGKVPKFVDSTESSFFDFFEPVNQKEEYSVSEEGDEIEETVDEQLRSVFYFANDIIPNSLYFLRNQMDKYDDSEMTDSDEDTDDSDQDDSEDYEELIDEDN